MVYEGERKKESIIDFAIKAAGPMVGIIENVQQLSQVSFLSFIFQFQGISKITLNFLQLL